MKNQPFHPRVRPTVIGIVLTVICLGLLVFSCLPKANLKPTPIVAITGSEDQTTSPGAPGSVTYLPTISNGKKKPTPPPLPTPTTPPTKPTPTTPPTSPTPVSPPTSSTPVTPLPSPTPVSTTPPIVPSGTGKIYYVATNGNDANAGTSTSPWKTLAKGVSVLQPGDALYIKSGTYVQTTSLSITKSGTSTSPITITTAPGEPSLAIISGDTNGDGSGDVPAHGTWTGLVNLNGSYLRFQNLEVAYSGERGIFSKGKFNTISGTRVHHVWNSGIYVYASDNVVEKSTLWRTADSNWCNGVTGRACNGDWQAGIAWGGAHDSAAPGGAPRLMVRNNTVYNTSGEGILCMHTDYATIEGNVVFDNWSTNIDLDQCSYTTIQKNLVYSTTDTLWWKTATYPSGGIMLSNEGIKDSSGNQYPIGHDRVVINNIMVGNGTNFVFWSGNRMAGAALINDLIANNTMVNALGTGGTGMRIDAGSHSNSRIVNNLVLETAANRIAYAGSTSGLTFANNFWSKTPPSNMASSTDFVGDPLMVDPNHTRTPGSVSADWYKVKSTSPAVNRAMKLSAVATDFWNTARGSAPDMGADEAIP